MFLPRKFQENILDCELVYSHSRYSYKSHVSRSNKRICDNPNGNIEARNVVVGKFEVVVRRSILLEFLERLVTEITVIHQKKYASSTCEFNQPINERD